MSVRNVFGQLLSSVGKSLLSLLKKDTTLATPTESAFNNSKVLIWEVLEGPYLRDEFDEDDLHLEGIPIGLDAMLVVMVEEHGGMDTLNFWYDTEEDALEVVKYFKVFTGPLEVT